MSRQAYGRLYSLVIGRPEKKYFLSPAPPTSIPKAKVEGQYPTSVYSRDINSVNVREEFADNVTLIPSEFREYTDLYIKATIYSKKSSDSSNKSKTVIQLYNMSEEEYGFIKKGYNVVLRAGYRQDISDNEPPPGIASVDFQGDVRTDNSKDLPLVFTGIVRKVTTIKEGIDTVTTILCDDGGYQYRGIRVSKEYKGIYTYRQIIRDLINEGTKYGLRFGNIFVEAFAGIGVQDLLLDVEVANYSVHGFLLDELDKICSNIGYKAYMCLGKIYIEPKYYDTKKPVLQIQNEEEVYSIRPINDGTEVNEGSEQQDNSIEVVMPLDGRFSVANYLSIETGEYSGYRDIIEVTHTIDIEGSDFNTVIKAKSR